MSDQEPEVVSTVPKSVRIAEEGIYSAQDFMNLMSAVTSDVLSRRITPQMANSVTNSGGKMLKAAEMTMKYGTLGPENKRVLALAEKANGDNK